MIVCVIKVLQICLGWQVFDLRGCGLARNRSGIYLLGALSSRQEKLVYRRLNCKPAILSLPGTLVVSTGKYFTKTVASPTI